MYPGTRVAYLSEPSDCAHFNVSKAEASQPLDRDPILIIPSRKSDRVLEANAKGLYLKARVGNSKYFGKQVIGNREISGYPEQCKRNIVGLLGVKTE